MKELALEIENTVCVAIEPWNDIRNKVFGGHFRRWEVWRV
jgi:hypothetical protein